VEPLDESIGVKLGRKYAHGRRMHTVTAVEEAQSLLDRMDGPTIRVARGLLRRALTSTSNRGIIVRPEEENLAQEFAAAGVLHLEEKVEGTAAVFHWRPYRVRASESRRDEIRSTLGKLDPDEARADLAECIADTPELAGELRLLSAIGAGSPLRVPADSRTETTAWTAYSAALRAAVGWYAARHSGRRVSARELAATTLGWSKAWTKPREDAFSTLINEAFATAVDQMEPEVRLRGPLRWKAQTDIVDAAAARPWVAIPARAALSFGTIDHTGTRGILVVENLDTFEAICRYSNVPDTWLCLWGHGYVNDSLVDLVKTLHKPTAAWSDLDAHGVRIVSNLENRLAFRVTPVFMDVSLHGESAYLEQDDEQRALAESMAREGHIALRELAAAIARTGLGREQETMHHLITELPATLSNIS
jgi:Uncharacterized protein conserved in bacteria C-term(DUF2220)